MTNERGAAARQLREALHQLYPVGVEAAGYSRTDWGRLHQQLIDFLDDELSRPEDIEKQLDQSYEEGYEHGYAKGYQDGYNDGQSGEEPLF